MWKIFQKWLNESTLAFFQMKSNYMIGALHIIIATTYLVMFILFIGYFSPYLSLIFFIFMLAVGGLHVLDFGPHKVSYILNVISLIYLLESILFLINYMIYFMLLLEVVTISLLVYYRRKAMKSKELNSSPMDLPIYG